MRTNLAYGVSNSYDFLVNKLGFKNLTYTDSQQVGNMALGGFEKGVTTEEMSAAYADLRQRGHLHQAPYVRPCGGRQRQRGAGERGQVQRGHQEHHGGYHQHLLQEAALNGTGYEAQFSGMHIAGKTGSTNSNKDRYFVGYTPYYSCAVWAGYEHNQHIVASGNPCAAIFRKVIAAELSTIHEIVWTEDGNMMAGYGGCSSAAIRTGTPMMVGYGGFFGDDQNRRAGRAGRMTGHDGR